MDRYIRIRLSPAVCLSACLSPTLVASVPHVRLQKQASDYYEREVFKESGSKSEAESCGIASYAETDRQADRGTGRQTNRQTDIVKF